MWQPINTETGQPLILKTADWPIAIHGTPKSGSSYFTTVLTANLIRRGEKVVFMCTKGDAIRALQAELDLNQPASKYSEVTSGAATDLKDMKLVTLFKRKGTDLVASLRALSDWSERVVVINNVEEILTLELWAIVRPQKKLILSGDFAKEKVDVDQKLFSSSILFSRSPGHWHHQRSQLPTYIGDAMVGKKQQQLIVREE
jgi:hypothetical protein